MIGRFKVSREGVITRAVMMGKSQPEAFIRVMDSQRAMRETVSCSPSAADLLICPYCGGREHASGKRPGMDDYHEWTYCKTCLEIIGWAKILMQPCPKCGTHDWDWVDGWETGRTSQRTCRKCGDWLPYPD